MIRYFGLKNMIDNVTSRSAIYENCPQIFSPMVGKEGVGTHTRITIIMSKSLGGTVKETSGCVISAGFLFPSGSLQTWPPHLWVAVIAPFASLITPDAQSADTIMRNRVWPITFRCWGGNAGNTRRTRSQLCLVSCPRRGLFLFSKESHPCMS